MTDGTGTTSPSRQINYLHTLLRGASFRKKILISTTWKHNQQPYQDHR